PRASGAKAAGLNSGLRVRDDRKMVSQNSFNTRATLTVGGQRYQYFSLPALERAGYTGLARLPYSLKILLENLLRREDGRFVDRDDIETLAGWDVTSKVAKEIAFMPARVTLQEVHGVHAAAPTAAVLHRLSCRGRSRRHARRRRPPRRRSQAGQPAAARRARHRSLRPGRSLLRAQCLRAERRAGVLAQPRALHLPALGTDRVRQLQGGAARHRHRP